MSSSSSSPFKSKEFLKLQKTWEKKLSDSGLENIEQADGNLKIWTSSFFRSRYNPTLWKAKEDYYRLAGQFLNDHKFESTVEKLIWQLHSEAVSIRNIYLELKRLKKKIAKDKIHNIIRKLADEMTSKCRS